MSKYQIWPSGSCVTKKNNKQLELKRAEEFSCNVPRFHPARGIQRRLAKIRHPSCSIFHGDSWDFKIEKHASNAQRGSRCITLCSSGSVEKPKISRGKSKNTQTWTLSPLKTLSLWRESQYSRNVLIHRGRDALGKRLRLLITAPLALL